MIWSVQCGTSIIHSSKSTETETKIHNESKQCHIPGKSVQFGILTHLQKESDVANIQMAHTISN